MNFYVLLSAKYFFVYLVCSSLADAFDSSTQLLENLRDPATANSDEPNCAPFNRAFKVDVPLWMWYDQPGLTYRRKRFSIGMHGATEVQPLHGILYGASIPWILHGGRVSNKP